MLYPFSILLLSLFIGLIDLAATIDISFYKQSYDCFQADKQYLSPLYGRMYYNTLIRGTYFIQPYGKPTKTQELCQNLFYSNDKYVNFHYTEQKVNFVHSLSPQLIASIILTIEQYRSNDNQLRDEIITVLHNLIESHPDFATFNRHVDSHQQKIADEITSLAENITTQEEQIAQHLINLPPLSSLQAAGIEDKKLTTKIKQIQDPATASVLQWEKLKKTLTEMSVAEDQKIQKIRCFDYINEWKAWAVTKEKLEKPIAEIKKKIKELEKQTKSPSRTLGSFVEQLVAACFESGLFKGGSVIYSTYTPYRLLQAFLSEKFDATELFNPIALYLEIMIPYCQPISTQSSQEANILALFSSKEFPTIDEYKSITYRYNNLTLSYTDCMENTIRHLIHILAYDPATRTFTSDQLKKLSPTKSINPLVEEYINTFSNSVKANTEDGHIQWGTLMTNIKGIEYISAMDKTGHWSRMNYVHKSVLKSPITLNGIDFTPADDKDYTLYEANSSARNLIIALNYLLNLNLFTLQSKDFFSSTFSNKYFPLLCQQLCWVQQKDADPTKKHTEILLRQENLTDAFKLTFNRNEHAKIEHVPHKTRPDLSFDVSQFRDDLLYGLTLKSSSYQQAWYFIQQLVQNKWSEQDLTDAYFTLYQQIITQRLLDKQTLTTLLKWNALTTTPQLIEVVKQFHTLQKNTFLRAFLALEEDRKAQLLNIFYINEQQFYKKIVESSIADLLTIFPLLNSTEYTNLIPLLEKQAVLFGKQIGNDVSLARLIIKQRQKSPDSWIKAALNNALYTIEAFMEDTSIVIDESSADAEWGALHAIEGDDLQRIAELGKESSVFKNGISNQQFADFVYQNRSLFPEELVTQIPEHQATLPTPITPSTPPSTPTTLTTKQQEPAQNTSLRHMLETEGILQSEESINNMEPYSLNKDNLIKIAQIHATDENFIQEAGANQDFASVIIRHANLCPESWIIAALTNAALSLEKIIGMIEISNGDKKRLFFLLETHLPELQKIPLNLSPRALMMLIKQINFLSPKLIQNIVASPAYTIEQFLDAISNLPAPDQQRLLQMYSKNHEKQIADASKTIIKLARIIIQNNQLFSESVVAGALTNQLYTLTQLLEDIKNNTLAANYLEHYGQHFIPEIAGNLDAATNVITHYSILPSSWITAALNNQFYLGKQLAQTLDIMGKDAFQQFSADPRYEQQFIHKIESDSSVASVVIQHPRSFPSPFVTAAIVSQNYSFRQFRQDIAQLSPQDRAYIAPLIPEEFKYILHRKAL